MIINYKDFTRQKYAEMLQYISANFECKNFLNFNEAEKFVIWRHDIDFSVHNAHDFAVEENKAGIKGIYYFLLRIEHYNLFEIGAQNMIREIKEMGHDVGLHFHHAHYGSIASEEELVMKLKYEKGVFENEIGIEINSFAYHDTTPEILRYNKEEYAGMLNVYSKKIREGIPYCSDSFGVWRFNPLMDELKEKKGLHALTHPILWSQNELSPRNRLTSIFDENKERFLIKYDDFVKKNLPEIWKL